MNPLKKTARFLAAILLAAPLLALAAAYAWLARSLPVLDGERTVVNLASPVTVGQDRFGIPAVSAGSRFDAARAIGYLTARDRLFQMDLMRRKTAGRLAEIFGEKALPSDRRARILGYGRTAGKILAALPEPHRRCLKAYSEGVNSYLRQASALPFEFDVLGYRPEAWRSEDSLLVILGMFENLTAHAENSERMVTVMAQTLPPEVVKFLTPGDDAYTQALRPSGSDPGPAPPMPIAAMSRLLAQGKTDARRLVSADLPETLAGSNAWAVAGRKTADGRAILANDMHLGLGVPNIWYRIEVHYPGVDAAGVILPGTPFIVAGGNRHVAWGMTNLSGDFLDLAQLELNPANPRQYRLGKGWQTFGERPETIRVKGGASVAITVRDTVWGPVSAEPLLGRPVAVRWAALDDRAVNLNIADLEQAATLARALEIARGAGGPQLNVILADENGHVAWTLTGKIPNRFGNDGLVSRSWAGGAVGWQGYIAPEKLPVIVDPPQGYVISANDRRFGGAKPFVIGHEFANGFRAYRINQWLAHESLSSELSLFGLQQDTDTEFYRYYQQLALQALTAEMLAKKPELKAVRDYLLHWNGRADTASLGLPVLVEFRRRLIDSVFTPFLTACARADNSFVYSWSYIDTPLQRILTEQPLSLLPDSEYRNWQEFIGAKVADAAAAVKGRHAGTDWPDLTWSLENQIRHVHPFSRVAPLLAELLDRARLPVAGCGGYCVRVAGPSFGASERLVVSPNHFEDAILHMPGGQSGHPLSPFYNDQQPFWLAGIPLPLTSGKAEHTLTLKP